MLDKMYTQDSETAIKAVGWQASVWSIQTAPLTFAHDMYMYDITAHTCSQKHMDKRWYKSMPPDPWNFLKVKYWSLLTFEVNPADYIVCLIVYWN